MKKYLVVILFIFTAIESQALSDRIRMGLAVSPGIAWSKPMGKDLNKGRPRFGVSYGFVLEYWFARNYGLVSGINGAFDGCNVKGRDQFEIENGIQVRKITEKYGFHYLELPAYIKMKSNDIKGSKFCFWGQVGATINITLSARANYSDSIPDINGNNILIEQEKILRPNNDVATIIPKFHSNFFDVRLGAGAGMEYRFDDRTSFFGGLFYHNGFINNIIDHDVKKEANVMRFFSLKAGVLF
ncbi:MAG: PorT family protein [Bacteroidetes bacterium]|nr:PorT family protein [Bacteroidota bacterium]